MKHANPWRTGRKWDVPGIKRDVTRELMNRLDEPEVLILSGARQVGDQPVQVQQVGVEFPGQKCDLRFVADGGDGGQQGAAVAHVGQEGLAVRVDRCELIQAAGDKGQVLGLGRFLCRTLCLR